MEANILELEKRVTYLENYVSTYLYRDIEDVKAALREAADTNDEVKRWQTIRYAARLFKMTPEVERQLEKDLAEEKQSVK